MDEKIIDWANKNSVYMKYQHFDCKIGIKDVIEKVANPDYIKSHSFIPFIHKTITFSKFSKKKGRYSKKRELYLSGHFDRCVYQYYSYLLNRKYNNFIRDERIQDVAIAYRSDMHKSNIHFAKEVFDFVKRNSGCVVVVGDFTNFFDNLDHAYLKQQLCKLLGVDKIPEDYYKVFKSITRFSYTEPDEIEKLIKEENITVSKKMLLPMSILRKHSELIHRNKEPYGIPQGSAISAVLSNIYMTEFDKACKKLVKVQNGLYRRYCDDIVFVFPNRGSCDVKKIFTSILSIVNNTPRLILSEAKTKVYSFKDGVVYNHGNIIKSEDTESRSIDYLGFSFNGKYVRIRSKTIGKYYYRAYGKADVIRKNNESSEKKIIYGKEKLYRIYSAKGATLQNLNFLSYVKRCERVFGKEEGLSKILYTHYGKLKKRLNKKG